MHQATTNPHLSITPDGVVHPVCQDGGVLRDLACSRPARLFTRFTAGTVVATGCSQLTFVLLFGLIRAPAGVSGAAAFLAGTVPNFLIHRFWTWRCCGPVGIRRELLPYLAVITFNGLVATMVTTGVDRFVAAALTDHALRTAVNAVAFSASYLPLFVLKFALLDRLVFGRDRDDATAQRRVLRSRNQVPTSTRA
jgi:putative flippase GtrA